MKKNNFTLGAKIYAGEGLTVGFLLLLGVFAVGTVTSLQYRLERVVNVEARSIELAGEINQAVTMLQNAQRGLLLGSMINDATLVRSATEHLAESRQKVAAALKEAEGKSESEAVRLALAKLRSMEAEIAGKTPLFEEQIRGQQFDAASKLQTEFFTPQLDQMQHASGELVGLSHTSMASQAERLLRRWDWQG